VVINKPIEDNAPFDDWFKRLLSSQPLVTMVSEMPYLALEWFHKKIYALGFEGSHSAYSVQKYRTPPRIDRGLVLYETWGKTEAKVVNGSVDFGLEITQTGSAIRNYGLQVSEELMKSETGIYANAAIKNNPVKYELARMFLLNLYGALFAENKVLMFFNARKDRVEAILEYLRDNRLFADEPTMNQGPSYTEFSVELSMDNPDLPLARVRYELVQLGATHLETVPLDSCIPGLDVLSF
jgi:hypothetical protein